MRNFSSLFQRNIRALVWVAFALLALLPLLSLVLIGMKIPDNAQDMAGLFEVVGLGGFALCSVLCGVVLLLHVADKVRELTEKTILLQVPTAAIQARTTPPGTRDEIQNELASLTVAIGHIQKEFADNLSQLQSQAAFLENLQQVLNNTSDMVLIIDEKNQVIFSNRAAREKLGMLPENTVRRSLAEGLLTTADTQRLTEILENWTSRDEDLCFTRAAGECMDVHCIQNVVELVGHTRRKIIILRDVTDRKHMERQLYRSEQLAALGMLISGVAHELNNPLSAVLGFAELCHDTGLTRDELQKNLGIIEREASRTVTIVENLLNFSRQRPNQTRNTVAVQELVERCFALLAYNFRTNNVAIRRNYGRGVPAVEVDEYQLQQVLMNLFINAAQAMRDAGTEAPALSVSTRLLEGGRTVCVDIADNGPGIATENQPRIFQPFFTTKKEQGTGLGLAISRSIVESHKGTLAFASQVGKGTTFTISLPARENCLPRPATADHAAAGASLLSRDSSGLWGRILVLDDESSILEMAEQLFTARGWEVSTASRLSEALQFVQEREFDVVVADLCMPEGDGTKAWNLHALLRPNSPCQVLFITGDPQGAANLRARLGASVQILLKPFHVNDFSQTVGALLRKARAATAGTRHG